MSSATTTTPAQPHYRLQANSIDKVQSLVLALLVLLGTTVLVLGIIFLFRKFSPEKAVPDLIPINTAPRGEKPKGTADDIEPPGLEDAPEINEPELQETLKELTTALTSKTAMLSDEVFNTDKQAGRGTGQGSIDGTGNTPGGGGNAPPKELRFEPQSPQDYAAMLDHFGVTLAVLDPRSKRIFYAKNLTAAKPTVWDEPYTPPQDFYFVARGAPLQPIEIELARNAGIMKVGATLITLWPPARAQEIYQQEQTWMHSKGRKSIDEIEKTYYRVERKGREFEIKVEDQTYF
jgi:hypothetical protein